MKRSLIIVSAVFALMLSEPHHAATTSFFNTQLTGSKLSILTNTPGYDYPFAGIKLNTPGYRFAHEGIECTPNESGYCLFAVNDKVAVQITIYGQDGDLNATLCLNGKIPLSCQNIVYHLKNEAEITPEQPVIVPPVQIAVGQMYVPQQSPLLYVSNDGGKFWDRPVELTLSFAGTFNAADCTGSGDRAICVAAGKNQTGLLPPLLAVSTNSGHDWVFPKVLGMPSTGNFKAVSCTGSDGQAMCAAVGWDGASNRPLITVSHDGGKNWLTKPITAPITGELNSVSCTGEGNGAVCVAAGTDFWGPPLLVVSTDGGVNWSWNNPVAALPNRGLFNSVACTGVGKAAVCAAAGIDQASFVDEPLLIVSHDGGESWAVMSVDNGPLRGVFNAVSCTGTGAEALCTAVGVDQTKADAPLLAVTTDGGLNWAIAKVENLPNAGSLAATSCTGKGNEAICTAGGQNHMVSGRPPLLLVTTNGGHHWTVNSTMTNLPSRGQFNATRCKGAGPTAICTAVGKNNTSPTPPLLAVSLDGGLTWALKTTHLPISGTFLAAGGV